MKPETKKIKDEFEAAVHAANIHRLVSIKFVGSRNKHGQYLVYYSYELDCWDECKKQYTSKPGKYDFFAAHNLQKKKETNAKKNIARSIKHIANELGIKIRLQSGNVCHHHKYDFDSALYRETGNVTLNY